MTESIREHVALAPFTTLGVGGTARWYVEVDTPEGVAQAHQWCADNGRELFVLGGGSNLVIADEGIDALVMRDRIGGVSFYDVGEGTLVTAGAGEPWDPLVGACVARGLAGLECLSGIPGCVGGTPIQTVGAYGQEVGDSIESVTVFDRQTGEMQMLRAADCHFSYRMSRFKGEDAGRFIVCAVTFRLHPAAPTVKYPDVKAQLEQHGTTAPTLQDVREAVLAVRRRKGMVIDPADPDTRSVGSFFMNPIVAGQQVERVASVAGERPPGYALPDGRVKVPAAWLIERAGFTKGFADGAVAISTKHPLALVNRGGATARDVLRLAQRIKRDVADRFGVMLRPEPIFAGFGHNPELEYLQKETV